MPNAQAAARCLNFIGFNDTVAGAFHAACHAQRPQQVAGEGGFTCTQIAVQGDECASNSRLSRPGAGKAPGGFFALPSLGFYNAGVTAKQDQFLSATFMPQLQAWGAKLGFSQIGVAGVDLSSAEPGLQAWLKEGFHGEMHYMASHGMKRARPAELVPGTVSVVTARMDYLPATHVEGWQTVEFERLQRPAQGIVSLYARGRDYHKVLRSRLQKLADWMQESLGPFGHRVFTDSAPVLEAELATRSGQGWRGKHTLVLSREAGSIFFLGEIYVDVALPETPPVDAHCGTCTSCIDICPTQAIIAPYQLDARRCISYLTIEHAGTIPLELRPLMGNRIYGCDDCQLVCPWNKFAQRTSLPDFDERAGLSGAQLIELFAWSEEEFLRYTEGSAIRRIGHERWLRNIAVALGNALRREASEAQKSELRQVLGNKKPSVSALVAEHIDWALQS
jgi:epoxyqueuosine reductase